MKAKNKQNKGKSKEIINVPEKKFMVYFDIALYEVPPVIIKNEDVVNANSGSKTRKNSSTGI